MRGPQPRPVLLGARTLPQPQTDAVVRVITLEQAEAASRGVARRVAADHHTLYALVPWWRLWFQRRRVREWRERMEAALPAGVALVVRRGWW